MCIYTTFFGQECVLEREKEEEKSEKACGLDHVLFPLQGFKLSPFLLIFQIGFFKSWIFLLIQDLYFIPNTPDLLGFQEINSKILKSANFIDLHSFSASGYLKDLCLFKSNWTKSSSWRSKLVKIRTLKVNLSKFGKRGCFYYLVLLFWYWFWFDVEIVWRLISVLRSPPLIS